MNAMRAGQAKAELSGGGGSAANVVDLEARLRRWQWTAGLTSAAAAVLLALLVFAPGNGPDPVPAATQSPVLASADPLVAQVPIGDTGLRLDVTYIPESERLLVAAIGLTADGVHDHELWLVPEDGGALQSLGVVAPGEVRSVALGEEIIANLGDGVELVVTREPIGGKPEGEEAGPVVAEGAFSAV
jgi:anti-sigma-K factor RskA